MVDRQAGATKTGKAAQAGGASRSQQVIVVEEGSMREQGGVGLSHSRQGSSGQTLEVVGQGGVSFESRIGSTGSTGSTEELGRTALPRAQGSQRVVVQHKKISVTESRESRA